MLLFVSGKYGGFRAMLPLLRACAARIPCTLLLCDQHLRSAHGEGTTDEVFRLKPQGCTVALGAGYPWSRQDNLFQTFSLRREGKFKAVVVYGDRLDALLAAAWAYEQRIPVMHLQAGDISGGVDEGYRLAIAHMAQDHFAPTVEAGDRLRLLGAPKEAIHLVGDHHVDAIVECMQRPTPKREKLIVAHLHPDTLASEKENSRIAGVLFRALGLMAEQGFTIKVMPPCTDRLRDSVLPYAFKLEGHLPMEEYIPLLQRAALFIGNSSTAIIECPVLGTPALTVGLRQLGRDALIRVPCEDPDELVGAMLAEMQGYIPRATNRGLGDAWKKTIEVFEARGLLCD